MMDLHPFSVRYSPFITSKRFSKYSRLILSGFVNGNREIRDVKSELDLGVSSVGMEPLALCVPAKPLALCVPAKPLGG